MLGGDGEEDSYCLASEEDAGDDFLAAAAAAAAAAGEGVDLLVTVRVMEGAVLSDANEILSSLSAAVASFLLLSLPIDLGEGVSKTLRLSAAEKMGVE